MDIEYTDAEIAAMTATLSRATQDPRCSDLGAFVMARDGDSFDYVPTTDPEADVAGALEVVARYTWDGAHLTNINEEFADGDE